MNYYEIKCNIVMKGTSPDTLEDELMSQLNKLGDKSDVLALKVSAFREMSGAALQPLLRSAVNATEH